MTLDTALGPFPAGSVILLSRIENGRIVALDACTTIPLHAQSLEGIRIDGLGRGHGAYDLFVDGEVPPASLVGIQTPADCNTCAGVWILFPDLPIIDTGIIVSQ